MAITFDGTTKLISLSAGTVSLGVRDLWSRWVDWLKLSDNSKFSVAFSTVGGDAIDPVAGTFVPVYLFLQNGWRIRPQEASHTLNVSDGILLVAGGGDPFVNTVGSFVVRVNYQQPVQAITVSTGGGGGGLTGEQAGQLASAANLWQTLLEGSLTAQDILRLLLAVNAGKSTVSSDGVEIKFRDHADTKDRVAAVADANGNRQAVVLDPS